MDALLAQDTSLLRCRRLITRAPEAGGEDYEAVDEATFERMVDTKKLALWWRAHGLLYGIPRETKDQLATGRDVLANLSRSKLEEASHIFPTLVVLSITAPADVLAKRLESRGRETQADIEARLARPAPALPSHVPVIHAVNDGPLHVCVAYIRSQLHAEHV